MHHNPHWSMYLNLILLFWFMSQVRGSEETIGKGMSGAASAEIERAQTASSLARDVRHAYCHLISTL